MTFSPRDTTHDVRIWKIEKYVGKKVTTYRVRWAVAGHERRRGFRTIAAARSFHADLLSASRRGEAFDIDEGLPVSLVRDTRPRVSWWDWALLFADTKWPTLAPNSRLSLAEALTTITMALLVEGLRRPDDAVLRRAMMQWAFVVPRRTAGPPPADLKAAADWLARNTRALAVLEDPGVVRATLDAVACKLDGTRAAASTIARKRAVLHNALQLAVEHGHFATHPMNRVRWRTPRNAEAVDPACVVNPEQARALLAAVPTVPHGARLVAFFGCLYYVGTRPSEALALREADLDLPDVAGEWGWLRLCGNDPEITTTWTDTGRRATRQLKHRALGEIRVVPCPPPLVALLREHIAAYGIGVDGRLFRGPRAGSVKESVYTQVWQDARAKALSPAETASPLVRRPYDLRHSCVSTWLAAGVDSAQIATWVGHSVGVLHRVYAHVLPGRDALAQERISGILGIPSAETPQEDIEPSRPTGENGDGGGPEQEMVAPRATASSRRPGRARSVPPRSLRRRT